MSPRARRTLIAAVAIVVALVCAAPLAVWLLVDTQLVRAQATRYVKEKTGRELTLNGAIGLSFYPFLGVELRDVGLGYPGQSGGPAFARFAEVDLRLELMPLLRRVMEVDGVRGSGGSVSLPGYELRHVGITAGAFGGTQETDAALEFTLLPAGGSDIRVKLAGPMIFNIPAQELQLREITGRVGDMSFTGALRGTRVLEAPSFDGRVQTKPFNPRPLLSQFGMPYAPSDGNAMTAASLTARVVTSPGRTEFRDLQLSLDGSRFAGSVTGVTARATESTSWEGRLSVDRLDVDRYVPAAAAGQSADPYGSLRQLIARARVDVKQLRAFGLQMANVNAVLAAGNGIINVSPIRAALYDGAGELAARMDVRGRVPAYHVDGQMRGVAVQPLLTDAQQITALSGTGDLSLRIDAAARDTGRLTQSAGGTVALSVRDGRIEGADFLKLVAQARALSDQVRGRPVTTQSDPADRTKFTRLSASAVVLRGVARSDDLELAAPDLQASGSGVIDLARQTIDYVVRARSDQAGNVLVPIAIAGPFSGPTYRIQTGAMLRDAAKDELLRQLKRRGLKWPFRKP